VLDEADRMLDMGFIHDIKRVMKHLPAKRQTLLFSATFSKDIRKLAGSLLHDPVEIDVAPRNATAELVSHRAVMVEKSAKRAVLSHLITNGVWQQVLVFTRTKHGANRLVKQLETDGIAAAALHGNKSQNARTKALSGFKDGRVRALVATDIAARGIDIDGLPHVVNYELPNVAEDYVHRIGRTGRAGAAGEAISLVAKDERSYLKAIEKLINQTVERMDVDGLDPAIIEAAAARDAEAAKNAPDKPAGGRSSRGGKPNNGSNNRGRRRGGGGDKSGGGNTNEGGHARLKRGSRRGGRRSGRSGGGNKPQS